MLTTRHPHLPTDPRFYQQVLDHLPAPALVVSPQGTVLYGNRALVELSGWSLDAGIGLQMLDVIHPDDIAYVIEAFSSVMSAPDHELDLQTASWSPVRFRVIGGDGSIIPLEVTGAGGVNDGAVGGIVYSVRPCRDDDLLTEVFRGVASHRPVAAAAEPLVRRLALPPLRLSAAIFEQRGDGSSRCVSATDATMAALPAAATAGVPWAGLVTEPDRAPFDVLPPEVTEHLRRAGLRSCFHAGAHAPDHEATLRVVACSEDEHTSAQGVLALIAQTRELLAIVAQKAYNDRVIANNATRDDLTGLPTRVGLVHRYERARSGGEECALLFVDLDGFKRINDEQGHLVGDRVLASVAERLVRSIRPDDFVSRIGGDEFAVLLTDARGRLGPETIESVARRVVETVNAPIMIDGREIPLAASVGVARAIPGVLDELMAAADAAMYRAKRAGGGRHFIEPGPMRPHGALRATLGT